MPERGLLSGDDAVRAAGVFTDRQVCIRGATLLQVTYEVDRRSTLPLMPQALTAPVPGYARLVVVTEDGVNASAAVLLGVRHALLPRNLVIAAAGEAPALPGIDGKAGSASLSVDVGHATAQAEMPGGQRADATVDKLRATEPALLRWDPWLTLVETAPGRLALAEWPVSVDAAEAYVARAATSALTGDVPRRMASAGIISACLVRGDVTFGPPSLHEM